MTSLEEREAAGVEVDGCHRAVQLDARLLHVSKIVSNCISLDMPARLSSATLAENESPQLVEFIWEFLGDLIKNIIQEFPLSFTTETTVGPQQFW